MENCLVIVKPDGMNEAFLSELDSGIRAQSCHVVQRKTLRLSRVDVPVIFARDDQNYVNYMTSGEVQAMIVSGPGATQKMRLLKFVIRETYRADAMCNFMHSTEPGNEYDLQFGYFFQELRRSDFYQYADQLAVCSNVDSDLDEVVLLDRTSCLGGLTLLATPNTATRLLTRLNEVHVSRLSLRVGVRTRCKFNHIDDQFVVYLTRDANWDFEAFAEASRRGLADMICLTERQGWKIAFWPRAAEFSPDIATRLSSAGVSALVCYSPEFSLRESELFRAAALPNRLACVGGSGGTRAFGRNGVSEELWVGLWRARAT